VVWPDEEQALHGALLAQSHGLIVPVLIGPIAKMRALAEKTGADLAQTELVDASSEQAAADLAVALARSGQVQAIMKGHLHTDVLLRPMLDRATGLRIGRRFTHVFVMDVPGLGHPLLVSDGAINIVPDLTTKVDIVQNTIDLAHSLGLAQPKVAILSAVETVSPDMPSSMDAAALSKMAERGQITGGLVDGPLAMDNAINMAAARTKGIAGAVAGLAEVLIVPNIEAGNMLAKSLSFLMGAETAGVVLGARVPITLTSRADSVHSRMASCAVAALVAYHRREKMRLANCSSTVVRPRQSRAYDSTPRPCTPSVERMCRWKISSCSAVVVPPVFASLIS
jgi:phosphate butyryltransferase